MSEPVPFSTTKYTKHMQDQPLVKKERRSANILFIERFEKMTIEQKESLIGSLTSLLNQHKQSTINEAQAIIDRLSGGKKLGTSEKPLEKISIPPTE